jgi:hypothetical protein
VDHFSSPSSNENGIVSPFLGKCTLNHIVELLPSTIGTNSLESDEGSPKRLGCFVVWAWRYNAPMRTVLLLCLAVPLFAQPQSQPPSPTPTIKSGQPQQPAASRRKQSPADERGSEQSPVVVKVLPSVKTNEEVANDKAKDLDQSSANWWMVRLTGAVVFVGCVQTIVFWLQARRLKQTIETMDNISTQQTKDVQASIAEATRVSKAMEAIAESMAMNVESVKESVGINREIADRQKLITELQSRAYLTIVFEGVVPQNIATGLRFEPKMHIVNRGNTPAHNIRFATFADVLPFPLRDDFTFPLPTTLPGHSSTIGPGLHKIISAVVPKQYAETEATQIASGVGQRIVAWGIVKYQDAFNIERFLRFGFTHILVGENQWMSQDTTRNNDSD